MFRFTAATIPNNIFVIGGGGTGSRLMPMLAQFMRSITRGVSMNAWVESPRIWIIDDDVVETKNLLRQNFIAHDVGKPKAVVLAERYGRAYNVDIIPVVERITSTKSFQTTIQGILDALTSAGGAKVDAGNLMRSSIVISCVDSSHARRDILNNFISYKTQGNGHYGAFFIDAGNEDSFGQVNFFHPVAINDLNKYDAQHETDKIPKMVGSIIDIDYVPMNLRYYKELVDTESTASCADLNQTLAINAQMATNIMNIVQNYYYRKPMTFNCLRVSLDGGSSTDFNTFHFMRRIALNNIEWGAAKYGESYVVEKNKVTTYLKYTQYVHLLSLHGNIAYPLKNRIYEDEAVARAERQRLEREEAARVAAEAEKVRLAKAKEREAQLVAEARARAAVQLQMDAAAKVEVTGDTPVPKKRAPRKAKNGTPVLDVIVQEAVQTSAALPAPPTVAPPPLTPAPRRRRTVALDAPPTEVPAAWVEAVTAAATVVAPEPTATTAAWPMPTGTRPLDTY